MFAIVIADLLADFIDQDSAERVEQVEIAQERLLRDAGFFRDV
jgi:hypothetical protein